MINLAIIKSELWTGKQFFWSLVVFMLFIALSGSSYFQNFMVFDFEKVVVDKEYWRLFTSQLVHWNLAHAISNMAVFMGAIWLISSTEIWRSIVLLLLLMLVMGLALLVVNPSALYAGFSANLYGLVVFLVLSMKSVSLRIRWLVVAVILVKLILEWFEFISTQSMSDLIEASVATEMHLLAVVFSLLFYVVIERFIVSRNA